MKILVLCGSARKHGNSNTLADSFIRGAEEAGHEVSRLDCSRLDVHQCLGCWKCGMNGPCVQKDDFEKVRELILPADAVVFVSPMYYFAIAAKLKIVIERFFAINTPITGNKKACLIMTYNQTSPHYAEPVLSQYRVTLEFLKWQDADTLICGGLGQADAVKGTPYIEQAYNLGRDI